MKVMKAESTLCEVRDNIQSRVGGADLRAVNISNFTLSSDCAHIVK